MYNTQSIQSDNYVKQFFSRNIVLIPTIVSAVLAITYIINAFTELSSFSFDNAEVMEYFSNYPYISALAFAMALLQAIPYVVAFIGFFLTYTGAKNQTDSINLNKGIRVLNIAGIVLIVATVINIILLVILITIFSNIFNDLLGQLYSYSDPFTPNNSLEARAFIAGYEFALIFYAVGFSVFSLLYSFAAIKTTKTIKASQDDGEYSYNGCTFLFVVSLILTIIFGFSTLGNLNGEFDILSFLIAAGCFMFNLFIAILSKQYKSMVSNINYQKIRAQAVVSSQNVYTGYNQNQYNPAQSQFNGYNAPPVVPTQNMYGSYTNQNAYNNTQNFQNQYSNQYTPKTTYQNQMNTSAQSFGAYNTAVQNSSYAQPAKNFDTQQPISPNFSSNNLTQNTTFENTNTQEEKIEVTQPTSSTQPTQTVQPAQPINGKKCIFCGNICSETDQFCPVCKCRLV